ncbi:dihydrofolate reductase-like domain-containing protein [Daldinia vernicosa]|uniref:dihydrofolate reductase-like domain-containing protein n=1 Tax=Daldinia vernicosa TaxID=114800 RepID=UPI0020072CBE|nr:dihydrofolate reductase-like domain-containing protein [Daldinia vernicosa]KAI0851757.1 dihydrofolate reductase-like domain-containing protein [Daldinia vernicosa]
MSNPSPSPSAAMLPPELTLIVAATRTMGIGRSGTLPWTGLKKEMAYFARVTKRLPPPPSGSPPALNAVIMGRKTWDSIPPKFQPLKGRLNIVVSRSHAGSEQETAGEGPVRVDSLEQALAHLKAASNIGRAFVIGGAQIYGAALGLKEARRVLLTRVLSPDFECDTFFPLGLQEEDKAGGQWNGWVKRSKEELDAWTGETVPEGVQEENGTRYEFEMWERVD